ncbi:MAG: LysE family transporter [Acidobacteriota bacterium]
MFIALGIFTGLIASIPLGPINVFVVSQTLKRDFFHGLLAGITTAVLDMVYCLVTLMGFFLIKFSIGHTLMNIMKAVAGLIVLAIAYRLTRQAKTFVLPQNGDKIQAAPHRPILGVILLYVSNPSLYVFWIFVAGYVTSHNLVANSGWTAVAFAATCGLSSFLWYFVLARFVARRQSKIRPGTFRNILNYLGLGLAALGVYTIASIFF